MKKVFYILIGITFLFPILVTAEEPVIEEIVTLEKCVDGDTATFKNKDGILYKTRFLAIDTPETVHPTKKVESYGKEASDYTCNALTNAVEIKLQTDPSSDREDKYGRLLAWIFIDGNLLQENLIKEGLAKVDYLYGDYQYTDLLKEQEKIAQDKNLKIWSTEENSSSKTESEPTKKSFWDKLVDQLLGKINDCLNSILDNIASWIEHMI